MDTAYPNWLVYGYLFPHMDQSTRHLGKLPINPHLLSLKIPWKSPINQPLMVIFNRSPGPSRAPGSPGARHGHWVTRLHQGHSHIHGSIVEGRNPRCSRGSGRGIMTPENQGGTWKTCCWYTDPSEKYEFVNWDDDLPNWMEKHNMFQTTNQRMVC